MPSRFRPLPYDEALARKVLDRIAKGVLLRDLWRDHEMPTRGDLRRWRHADPAFEARVRAAVNAARSRRMPTLNEDVAWRIFHRLCDGESLPMICADPDMPGVCTIYDWLRRDREFRRLYILGRQIQGETLGERSWEICQAIIGSMSREAVDAEDAKLRRLRWHTSKVAPKKWGRNP